MSACRTMDFRAGSWIGTIALAAAAGLLGLTPAAPAAAADFTMKIGTATINETQHQFIKFYKDEVEKASGGRIEVQIYPASQLGPIPREIEGVQLGNIQGYVGPVDFFVGVDPRFGVFSTPMLFRDDANAAKTVHDAAIQKAMFELATPKRMVGMATLSLGASDYGAKNAIMKLADFNGKKLRINGTDAERERFKRLGATSVPMNLADMLTALQNGTIDGSGSGITIWVNFKLETVSKDLLQTEDTLIISNCAMSKKWLDTLPADLRATVVKESRAQVKKGVELSDKFLDGLTKKWGDAGGNTKHLSDAEQAEMRAKFATVADTVLASKPDVRAFYDEVKAVSDKTP
jgi:TRAP-type transport system periplasmic protein